MIRDPADDCAAINENVGAPTLDENAIRHFRNRLTETGTLKRVMKASD